MGLRHCGCAAVALPASTLHYTQSMARQPVFVYYMCCPELGCWVLFNVEPGAAAANRLGHRERLDVTGLEQGLVTKFEASQGWTKQKPDIVPIGAQHKAGTLAR